MSNPFTRRNAIEISNTRFIYDVEQLINAVCNILDATEAKWEADEESEKNCSEQEAEQQRGLEVEAQLKRTRSVFGKGNDNGLSKNPDGTPTKATKKELRCKNRQALSFTQRGEWEYAARSGGKEEKWAGTSREEEPVGYAWYVANSEGKTQP